MKAKELSDALTKGISVFLVNRKPETTFHLYGFVFEHGHADSASIVLCGAISVLYEDIVTTGEFKPLERVTCRDCLAKFSALALEVEP